MKFILVMMAALATGFSQAETSKLGIERIDRGLNSIEPDLIYFSDGRVGVVPQSPEKINWSLDELIEGSTVEVELLEDHTIKSLKPINTEEATGFTSDSPTEKQLTSHYEPTIVADMSTVSTIFKRMNRGWQKESQCYNRAHVWNYEEFQRSGLRSKKVFIFYTRRYIRDYNFKWWFHAIPTVLVNVEGNVQEKYLDPTFARRPLNRKDWTDIFIRSRRDCPVITKYSTYANNQESEHCYLHFSSMYYWQPRDLDRYERTGFEKTSFIRSEINHAYWEAF